MASTTAGRPDEPGETRERHLEARASPEPLAKVWMRRLISIPGLFLVTAILVCIAPAIFLVVVPVDVVRRNDLRWSRFYATVAAFFVLHVVGLILLFDAFLRGGALWGAPESREMQLTARAEAWWSAAMLGTAAALYRMKVDIEGRDELADGRVVVLMRHTSILDTMLPLALVARPHRKHVRYVMKNELRWNPDADVVGRRIPTAFVSRKPGKHAEDIAAVNALGDDLGPDGIVVIYPEGTRFTREKQEKRLADVAKKNPRILPTARSLRHLLPLHLGGALALLKRAEGADVAFFAHVGLDGVVTLGDFAGGGLLDRHIRVKIFRVPAAEVPASEEARIDWLYEQWKRVDDWIEATLGSNPER